MKELDILKEIVKYQQGGMVPPRMGLDLGGFQATSQPVFDGVQVQPSSVNIQPFLQGVQTIQSQDRLNLAANQALQNKESDIRNFNATIAKSMLKTSANSTSNQTKLDLTSGWQAELHAKIVAAQEAFKNGLATIIGSGNQAINPAEIMALKKPLDDLLNSEDYKRAIQVNGFRDDLLKSVAAQREKTDVLINGDAMKKKLMDIQAYAQDPSNPDIDISDIFDTSDLFYNSKDVVDNLNKMIDKYETASKEELARIDPDNPGMAQTLNRINPKDTEEYSKALLAEAWNSPGTKAWAQSLGYNDAESFRKGILKEYLDLRRDGLGSKRDVVTGIRPLAEMVLTPGGELVSPVDPRYVDYEVEREERLAEVAIRKKQGQEAAKVFAPQRQGQGSVIAGYGSTVDSSFFKGYPGAKALYYTSGDLDIPITPDEAIELAGLLEEGTGFTAANLEQIFRVADKFDTANPEWSNKEVIENTRAYLEGKYKDPKTGKDRGLNIPNPFGEDDWALQTIQNIYERTVERRKVRSQSIQPSKTNAKVNITGDDVRDTAELIRSIEAPRSKYGDRYDITEEGNNTTALGPYQFTYSIHKEMIGKALDNRGVDWSSIDLSKDMVGKEGGLTQKEFDYLRDNAIWGDRSRMVRNRLTQDDKKKAIAFLRTPNAQEDAFAQHRLNLVRQANALRNTPGSGRFTDTELLYLAHHHGPEDAKYYIANGKSPIKDADRDITQEIDTAIAKLRAVQINSGMDLVGLSANLSSNPFAIAGQGTTPVEGTTPGEGTTPVEGRAEPVPKTNTNTAEPVTGNTTASKIMSEQMDAEQGSPPPPPQRQSETTGITSAEMAELEVNDLNKQITDLTSELENTPETDEYGRSLKKTRDSIQSQIDSLSRTLGSKEAAIEKQEERSQEKDRLAQEFLSKLPAQKETKVDYVNMMGLGPLYVRKSNTTPPKFLVKQGNNIIAEGISEQELRQLLKTFSIKKK